MNELKILPVESALSAGVEWPDVYFTPAYGHACEVSDSAPWEVAVSDSGRIVFPFLKRHVDPSIAGFEGAFDVVSPYGYAGTWVAPGVSQREVTSFRKSLRSALAERGGLAEFHRCSGLVPGVEMVEAADPLLAVERLHDTVGIDLTRGYEACWAAAAVPLSAACWVLAVA